MGPINSVVWCFEAFYYDVLKYMEVIYGLGKAQTMEKDSKGETL